MPIQRNIKAEKKGLTYLKWSRRLYMNTNKRNKDFYLFRVRNKRNDITLCKNLVANYWTTLALYEEGRNSSYILFDFFNISRVFHIKPKN